MTSQWFQVEFRLDTTMWNEGFEQAHLPWLVLFTDNKAWVDTLPAGFQIDDRSEFGQLFTVHKYSVQDITYKDPYELDYEASLIWNQANGEVLNEEDLTRYIRTEEHTSSEQLTAAIEQRLSLWDGI